MAKPALRKPKKKVCVFCKEKIGSVDYKDTALLRKYISDRGKIRARRVSGNCTQHQRDVATAGQERARGGAAALHLDRSLTKEATPI
jgi:ribosomal protein S18